MKNTVKLMGILAISVLVGFGFFACDEPKPESNGGSALTGTVSIIGSAQVGQTLTVNVSYLGGSGNITYKWNRDNSENSTYTILASDVGSSITVTVTRSDNSGSVTSAPTDIVTAHTPGLAYTLINNNTAYSVSKGTATSSVIIIPSVYEGLPVVAITDSGFTSHTNMTSIIIPNGVTKIGNYAFFQCNKLESIVIPAGITNIGTFAFDGCSSLTTVYYSGASSSNWAGIAIGTNNTKLTAAHRYYYSETDPRSVNMHWRFVDGFAYVWINYSVTFISNGGSTVVSQVVSNGEYAVRPADPTRNGYIFDGWYSDAELTTWFDFYSHITESITLHADWVEAYTVTFNSNGGSAVAAQYYRTDSYYNNYVAYPADPTRSGYIFDGWYSDAGLTTVYDFYYTPVTSNITLYAKWLKLFTVTFNSNGGSAVNTQEVPFEYNVNRPTNPTRSGYVFDSWYSDSGLTTGYNFTTPVTSNITLYAKWLELYTVTFNSNGGSSISSAQNIVSGRTVSRPTDPTRSGYVFSGWCSDSGLTTGYNFTTPVTSNITLYAKWIELYTVIFNSNGGSTVADQMITKDRTATLPVHPTRSGYIFSGWYSDTGLTTGYNFTTPITSNKALYAKWNEVVFSTSGIEMVQIPTGTLTWGSATITLSAFKMGIYEVTQELYEAVMGINPSNFYSNPVAGEVQGKHPVENVTWYDAIIFCNKLSIREGLNPTYKIGGSTNPADWGEVPYSYYDGTGYVFVGDTAKWDVVEIVSSSNGYRLPTEAQWELACRAGSTTDWHFGNIDSELVNYAWYRENSNFRTHQVGLKLPNAFGLYDMLGNVEEWCWDWSGNKPTSNQMDYTGAASGDNRIVRSGGYGGHATQDLRSLSRNMSKPSMGGGIGFRVVRP